MTDADASAPDRAAPGEAGGLQAWRDRLLSSIFRVVLVLGTLTALASTVFAVRQGLWAIPLIDALSLGAVALLWRWRRLDYRQRAAGLLLVLYALGVWFLAAIGPAAQMYLLALPVMAALLLGLRAAIGALVLNALTLVCIGVAGLDVFRLGSAGPLVESLLMAVNFSFVGALMAVPCAVLLSRLESSLARERAVADTLQEGQRRLRAVNAELSLTSAALSRLNDLVIITEPGGFDDADRVTRIVFVNDAFVRRTGYSAAEVIGQSPLLLRGPRTSPEDVDRMRQAVQCGDSARAELVAYTRDGSPFWLELDVTPILDADGRRANFVYVGRDVSERKQIDSALRESEARWKLALESTGDGVWDWYPQTGVEIFSQRFRDMYGYSADELPDRAEALDGRTHPDDLERLQRDRDAHFAGRTPTYVNEHRVRCRDGSWKWVLSRGMVISRDEQGRPLRMIGTHTDITDRKRSESLIWQQANFDPLTGLPNRRMLRDRLAQDMRRSRREGRSLALLFIDLDHFKEVNDTLGHAQGDVLLVEAARRIRACVRESDTVARMGGDEFTVVLPALAQADRVERIASDILEILAAAFPLGDEQVYISASVGITLFPDDAVEIDDLFKQADQALYSAKGAGRNRFSYFTPALQESAQTRVRLTNDLRGALAGGQFRLVYQPIVELATGAIRKAEALLRWQHPVRGAVSPAAFIPIAESTGMIAPIGDWVLAEAAQQAQRWRAGRRADFQVSVNASPVQFRQGPGLAERWRAQLERLGLPGEGLSVEITEGLLLDAGSGVAEQLRALRQAGVAVSLDDFGTGYSSLSYLQRFDIDFLKIDQAFVRGLTPTSKNMALCKAIIVMAHELGIRVVAEGVETAAQRDLLAAAGCDFGQGYLFARPMPAAEFEALLAAHHLSTV